VHRIGLVLAALITVTPVAQADSLSLQIAELQAAAGSEVAVPVVAEAASGLGALQTEVVFDPQHLEPLGVEAGSLLANALLDGNIVDRGRLRVALVSGEPVAGSGELLVLRFKVLGGVGKTASIELAKARAWNHAHTVAMHVDVQPGQLTVVEPSRGFGARAGSIAITVSAALLGVALLLVNARRSSPHA
jgi:hypothetical protein